MKRVLLANIPPSVAAWLELRLGGLEAVSAEGEEKLGRVRDDGSWDLTIIQHSERSFSSVQFLSQLRDSADEAQTPIIYVADETPDPDFFRLLVEKHQVDRLLTHPMKAEELLAEVSRILKLPIKTSREKAAAGVAELWKKFRPAIEARVDKLAEVGLQLLEGHTSEESIADAQGEAHKLAGSLGMFGLTRGTQIARRLDSMLLEEPRDLKIKEFSDLVLQLRRALDQNAESALPDLPRSARQVVVLDAPNARLEVPTQGRNYELVRTQHPGSAHQLLSKGRPVAILVHLGVEAEHEQRLAFLKEASQRHPDLPLLAFVPEGNLDRKLEALRHGALVLLDPKLSPHQIGRLVTDVLRSQVVKIPRILILDPDPKSLERLEQRLTKQSMLVEKLTSLESLLETFHRFQPDLVLLEANLPESSGYEICRLLRGIPRWQTLPIVLMAETSDSEQLTRGFEARADDFVLKSHLGPDFPARILSLLERNRQLRHFGSTDPVTGLPTWVRGEPRLKSYLYLAQRLKRPVSIVMLEIDGLSDQLPGEADRLLARLGQSLTSRFRGEDLVCHFEKDTLVLGLFGMKRSDGIQRLNNALYGFQTTENRTFCAGLAVFPEDAESIEGLSSGAGKALEQAQELGPGHVVSGKKTYAVSTGPTRRVDVAVVDDDSLLGPLLIHALEQRGYSTLWIRDGLEASRRLIDGDSKESAKLILMEVDLPGQSGHSLLRQLKAADKLRDSKVLIVSARGTEKDILMGLELGATDHISKPFAMPILFEKVRLALQP